MVFGSLWVVTCSSVVVPARAAAINADPSNYRAFVSALKPGDTLYLAPGRYPRLAITGLNGTPAAWIAIRGPASGSPAVIVGAPRYNTVEILNSSYVAIDNLRIDSLGIPGAFGISARGAEDNLTHDIRIEGNILVGQNGGQQTDGISTKTPTWGWIIRNNQILGAGTGLYLGDSDGTQPFVGGIIENNLIKDTIGYNMEIKDQISIPAIPDMPLGPSSTIIRNNVFIKNDQPSPDGDRPNLLVGAFPSTGAGSLNMYEIYGNYFFHNHREALLQASGRVSVHDNVFADGPYTYPAVVLRRQNYPLKIAHVYNNTVYTYGRGIYFGTRALIDDSVVGNLVFAGTPISGSITNQSENMVDSLDKAATYVNSPSFDLGSMDFYPLPNRCVGVPIDLSPFRSDADYVLDFNGTPKTDTKGAVVLRGAYAGEGPNSGWPLQGHIKPPNAPSRSPAAYLVWISPDGAQAGTNATVTLTGANLDPEAVVSVSGAGVVIDKVTVRSATELTASFNIAATAASGIREVMVREPFGSSSNALRFRVRSRPRPNGVRK
jgi:hypothetical protein